MADISKIILPNGDQHTIKDSTARSGLNNKVDKVTGKGLSTNDFTDALETKLNGIAAGAEVNVQSDWNVTDSASDAFIKNKPAIPTDTWKAFYGTCSTAAATAEKAITVSSDQNFSLKAGAVIGVKFTVSNKASNVKLNVNGTGAKSIWYNTAVYTGASTDVCGYANRVYYYLYDGTYWCWVGFGIQPNSNTVPTAYCYAAAGTAEKAASCTNYVPTANTYIPVLFTNANSVSGAITLNINDKGAKPIYINGLPSSTDNHTLPAGSYIAYYNGSNYYFRTDGELPWQYHVSLTSDVVIPKDANLNSTTYLRTGSYANPISVNTASIQNKPADCTEAFMLNVYSPLSGKRTAEVTSGNWIYRLQEITLYTGKKKWARLCSTNGEGEWGFAAWTLLYPITNATTVNNHTVNSDVPANAVFTDTTYTAASATPKMDGTGAVGTSAKYAREDHVHPSDTTKVDKVTGKGLSTNDFTDALETKLNGIAAGAEANVQSDWSVTDTSSDAFIKNKPTIPTKTGDLTNNSNFVSDASYVHSDNNFTTTEKNKLAGIATGAEVNVQSDWNVTDTSSDAYIKNKPTIPTVPSAATAKPVVDGTAAVGTSTKYAREDHVHPTDTSRAPKSHASTATTYGLGDASNYGHVKLSDTYSSKVSNGDAAHGLAASQNALYNAYTNRAPINHAQTASSPLTSTTYGIANETQYGHVMLTDKVTGFYHSQAKYGIAASSYALAELWNGTSTITSFAVYNHELKSKGIYIQRYHVSDINGMAFIIHKNAWLCMLTGIVEPTQNLAAGEFTLWTIPDDCAKFRPKQRVAVICQGSGLNRFLLAIETDGTIKLDRYGTTGSSGQWPSGCWLNLYACYIACDDGFDWD